MPIWTLLQQRRSERPSVITSENTQAALRVDSPSCTLALKAEWPQDSSEELEGPESRSAIQTRLRGVRQPSLAMRPSATARLT